ncbi:hypothetical protein BS50DRAFT_628341 [Corynespora cassiicola Philippines]|uniref:MYND-type domain-containing protein n=1 Tax=Corynespora cassiicola Philippines TaxID=1448308 RepID=A0A2T2PC53_CORCC|nr:hypothetical protein BS50DRAFT_628341 [Corynespora cassiicola Philippines]
MPPRSVCLNVFTTSLGNGKEAVESVRDMAADKSAFGDDKVVQSQQNVRRDSTQTSPNGSIVAPTPAHIATADINIAAFSNHVAATRAVPSACDVCATSGGLSRCSRCKSRYYCSRSCQKLDWKSHKLDCGPGGANSAQSTPNVSTPASPINDIEMK